jgi:hypothetical protein
MVTLVLYVLIMAAEQQLFAIPQQMLMLQLIHMLALLILVPVQDMVDVLDLTSASAHKDGQETHAKQQQQYHGNAMAWIVIVLQRAVETEHVFLRTIVFVRQVTLETTVTSSRALRHHQMVLFVQETANALVHQLAHVKMDGPEVIVPFL